MSPSALPHPSGKGRLFGVGPFNLPEKGVDTRFCIGYGANIDHDALRPKPGHRAWLFAFGAKMITKIRTSLIRMLAGTDIAVAMNVKFDSLKAEGCRGVVICGNTRGLA